MLTPASFSPIYSSSVPYEKGSNFLLYLGAHPLGSFDSVYLLLLVD